MSSRNYSNHYAQLKHPQGGKHGTIPRKLLEDRFEITLIDEDPDRANQFMRNTLKDFRADPVLFESDNQRTSGLTSVGALNLRLHGSRGNTDGPNHSEMFLGFTDHDPRGTATDPDFGKYTEDSWKRRKRTEMNLYPDKSEDKITQGGMTESHITEIKKKMFYPVKDRLLIFKTEQDGELQAGRPYEMTKPALHQVRAANIDPLYNLQDHQDFIVGQDGLYRKPDHTVLGSLYVDPFQKHQADQKLAVAKYGMIKRNIHLSDIMSNRTGIAAADDYWQESSENDGTLQAGTDSYLVPNIYKAIEYAVYDQQTLDGKPGANGIKVSDATIKRAVESAISKFQQQSRLNGKDDSDVYNHIVKSADGTEMEHMALYTKFDNKEKESREHKGYRGAGKDTFNNAELYSMQLIQKQMTGRTSEQMGIIVRSAALKDAQTMQKVVNTERTINSSHGRVLDTHSYKRLAPKATANQQEMLNADQILKQSFQTMDKKTADLSLLPSNMGGMHNTDDDASKQALAVNEGVLRNKSIKTIKSNYIPESASGDTRTGKETDSMLQHSGLVKKSLKGKRASVKNMKVYDD